MTLFWKIYLSYLGLFLLAIGSLTAAISYMNANRSMAQLRDEHRLLAMLATSQVEAGYHEKIWPFEMLRAITQEPSVTSWSVVNGMGRVILADRPQNSGGGPQRQADPRQLAVLSGPQLLPGADAQSEMWIVPMRMHSGSKPWTFRLTYDCQSVREQIRQLVLTNSIIALAVSVLLAPISLFVTRHVLRPLVSLTHAVRTMERGALPDCLPAAGPGEIGRLIAAFSAMANVIHNHKTELESQVEQRTNELRLATITAEAATRAKSEFLANMSHEIRTPMTAILGYADLMLDENIGRAMREHVTVIKRNGEHLLGLIGDVLDLSKIEAGKLQIEPTRCSLAQLVAEVDSLMRAQAAAKHLTLKTELAGPLPETALTDPLRLRQVLVNLVGNAIKFTDQGEVRFTVRLNAGCGRSSLRFDVTDTGIGMNEEQIRKLFKPFSQVDNSSTRKFGGTGLGLCISRHLVEALGGAIEVHSEPGKGSTFSVMIDPGPLDGVPMIADAQTVATALPPKAPPAAAGHIAPAVGSSWPRI